MTAAARDEGLGIRPVAGRRDLPLLRDLLRQCSPVDRIRRAGHPDVHTAAGWLLPRLPGGVGLVAIAADGRAVGTVTLNRLDTETGEVALIVVPEWRRRGVGRRLLEAALGHASGRVVATVGADNLPALRLAAAAGARPCRDGTGDYEILRQSEPDWRRRDRPVP